MRHARAHDGMTTYAGVVTNVKSSKLKVHTGKSSGYFIKYECTDTYQSFPDSYPDIRR